MKAVLLAVGLIILAPAAYAPGALAQIAVDGGPQAPSHPLSQADMAALDKEFDAAVQAARASLPVFWGRLAENPGAKADFGLKVAFHNASGGVEEIWLGNVQKDGARIVGRLNYDPQSLPNLHRNDIVPVREADIVDWSFKEGRKRYGEFTTRVLAKAQPEESARTMAQLSDNPLPADARK